MTLPDLTWITQRSFIVISLYLFFILKAKKHYIVDNAFQSSSFIFAFIYTVPHNCTHYYDTKKNRISKNSQTSFPAKRKIQDWFFFLLTTYGVSIVVINLSYLLTKILLPFSFCLIVLAILLTKEFEICRLYLTFAINHAAERFRCLSENTISLCVRQLRCASIHLYLRCFCI